MQDLISKISILNGSKYFPFGRLQKYLVFDLVRRNSIASKFSTEIETDDSNKITSWKSTGMLQEKIVNPYEQDTNFSPEYDFSYE